jgi:uncharacterized protein
MKFLSTIALGLGLIGTALAPLAITPTYAQENTQIMKLARTINLSGHGEIRMVPDLAAVTIGVTSNAKTAGEALAQNTKDMQAVFATLKAAGIADSDIQTSNFSVNPRFIYPNDGSNKPPTLDGYDVVNSVNVVVRKISELGSVLDKVVTAGSNQINGISFSVDNADKALDAARTQAVADARHKAELYATAAGVKLGRIISIAEGGNYQPPPVVYTRAKMATAEAAPIAQGEQVLGMDVTIVWEIE